MKKTVLTTLALAASAAIAMIGAAPASAAGSTIDPGDSLYAINCDTVYFNWQLLSVDASTGFSTKIGTGDGYDETYFACAGQPAWDASTGKSYYIQWHYTEGADTFLASIDVTTGVSTEIGEFFSGSGEFIDYPYVESIAIGKDGAAFALSDGNLYSVNLATAELTLVGPSLYDTWAFAVDPTSGEYYAIDEDSVLFRVDTATGSYENLGNIPVAEDSYIYSLQIDGGGTFWIEVDDDTEAGASLWSITLSTLATPVLSGEFIDDPYYTEALLLIPGEPVLPATGTDFSVAPIAAGLAGVLTLLGAAVVVTRRRRTA